MNAKFPDMVSEPFKRCNSFGMFQNIFQLWVKATILIFNDIVNIKQNPNTILKYYINTDMTYLILYRCTEN